ncbi:MAG TPA: NAD-glutamate dehydrogenase [Azospirillaceae bacterium]|nr:NAD-glutamate dehydrogenase [Azospirillaceae bacterium]
MPDRHLDTKSRLLEQTVALVAARLGPEEAPLGERFTRLFYANVPPVDMAETAPEDLAGAALACWRRFVKRTPGKASVAVFKPTRETEGFSAHHSAAVSVNDDMPFLVDSTTDELTRRGWAIHLVIHPVLAVRRTPDGHLAELYEPGKAPADAAKESVMLVAFDEQTDPQVLAEVQTSLEGVLADVRAAVTDWRAMTAKAWEAVGEIARGPVSAGVEELAEAQAFLEWLIKDKFTFLGYREYRFEGDSEDTRTLQIVGDAGLGILRDPDFTILQGLRNFQTLPPEIREFLSQPRPMMVTRSTRRSTVHRAVPLDAILVKTFDANGRITGERLFVGLFTSVALAARADQTPFLRRKVQQVLARSGFDPRGHDGKALIHIIEHLPRHELYQMEEEALFDLAVGVLHLQERQRTALFIRRDPFERFVSSLVYVPRDRYDTAVRRRFQTILERAFGGGETSFNVLLGDDPLARVHIVVQTEPGRIPAYDAVAIENELIEASRSWADKLREVLVARHGEAKGLDLLRRHADVFPAPYREQVDAKVAPDDLANVEQVTATGRLRGVLHRTNDGALAFRIFHPGAPIQLSRILPVLENFGLPVAREEGPFELKPAGTAPVFLQDFVSTAEAPDAERLAALGPVFEEAFLACWERRSGNDRLNRLVLLAGLDHRQVTVLRAYARYLRQVRFPNSQEFLADTLAAHPEFARDLIELFTLLFDPARQPADGKTVAAVEKRLEGMLAKVQSLEEDRALRRFMNLIRSTLRTNHFKTASDGTPLDYLSLKLDSRGIDGLPKPRPFVEIFVYNQRVEAIHLRGGRIARGGIRWSDRREDFRTEILGLMRTQMVKNAVIVPVGSKGGFVVKRPPAPSEGREAFLNEGVACYRIMMRGMLDITDTLAADGTLVPPTQVVRRDGDDPYLVVAADKGTATFSDIANGISQEYGFWLDDAFASGGSAGYDHKKMGITARGAWESVKRHFRELGLDTQSQDFTVAGVGDMSGDVFGNGMLLSEHIRLVAAFDHRHIFLDPDPDPARSFAERKRLFDLPRSSWADYDAKLLSKGGMIVERTAKEVKLTPEVRARLGIEDETVTPADLMRAILSAQVDLLWFGGIGTYIRATTETDADAGDKANDALRITAADVRAKVVGEGANLAMTQKARIEAARHGVRLNTDFLDNSAGVDTSDHEVNIKILLGEVLANGAMDRPSRDKLLAEMTDEVAQLVLRDNYLQTQALSIEEALGSAGLEGQARLLRDLEKSGKLDRTVEMLPGDEEIAARRQAGQGLMRPELAVLLSYAKIRLFDDLLATDLPDDPQMETDLVGYFPTPLRDRFRDAILRHRLRREIVATAVANGIVNRMGPTFVPDTVEKTGAGPGDVARAFVAAREVFDLPSIWAAIEALDNKVPASVQIRMLQETRGLLERAVAWLAVGGKLDLTACVRTYGAGVKALSKALPRILSAEHKADLDARAQALTAEGVPADLAARVAALPVLAAALDVTRIAETSGKDVGNVAVAYFALGHRFGFEWLRGMARALKTENHWERQALAAVVDDLYAQQSELTVHALRVNGKGDPIQAFAATRPAPVARAEQLLTELRAAPTVDLAMLSIANRQLRGLVAG